MKTIGTALQKEIEHTFQVVREKCSGDELVFLCPECDDKSGHRSVNLRTGLTYCFKCNKGSNDKGYFPAWAKALGFTFSAGAESGGHGSSVADLLERLENPPRQRSPIPSIKEVSLPTGFTPIASAPESVYSTLITRMAQRKHLDYEDFADAGAGFTEQDMKWEPFCIFPVTDCHRTVYYQGRTYVDVPGETTKRFPSREEIKDGAANWVYNIDEVREKHPHTVVVVESILNVLSLRKRFKEFGVTQLVPVCVFKHFVSKVQALKMLGCRGVKEFCFLFDRDALEQTWKIMPAFSSRVRVSIAEMPFRADNPKLDPNDDVGAAIDALVNRTRYTAARGFSHKMRRILKVQ